MSVIPPFGCRGKEPITFRHLLTHTAGIGHVDLGWSDTTWDEQISRICKANLLPGAVPGECTGYDVANAWFILGEAVKRRRMIEELTRRALIEESVQAQDIRDAATALRMLAATVVRFAFVKNPAAWSATTTESLASATALFREVIQSPS